MNAIEFINVTKTYKKNITALNRLNITVKQGKLTGFIGVNGAGKTTSINIISGLLLPDFGNVKIFEEQIRKGDWAYKKSIGFVLEKPAYLEYLTGQEFLEFVSIMFEMSEDISKNRINELLEFFELTAQAKELIKTYSKGMIKKISLAAAILPRPKLLVLDEPLEGLDPISAYKTKKLFRSFVENGGTIFFSSHELGTVEDICDEIVVIHQGKNQFQGTIENFKKQFSIESSDITSLPLEELFVKMIDKNNTNNRNGVFNWI
ncbi:ABC transporter ATP-binding protein [Melioribacteraceae bacterium 4301-Me]|uniref:ABC transporter ATP-binding protein n=1 Tax=Pyranulibacter aquaticus TaxID=3163344 RepID=UPI00359B60E3